MKLKLSILLLTAVYFSNSISMDVFENEDNFEKSFNEKFEELCNTKLEVLDTKSIEKIPNLYDSFCKMRLLSPVKENPDLHLVETGGRYKQYLLKYLNLMATVAQSDLDNKVKLLYYLAKQIGNNKFLLNDAESKIEDAPYFNDKLDSFMEKYAPKFEGKSREEFFEEINNIMENNKNIQALEYQINLVHDAFKWNNQTDKENNITKEKSYESEEEEYNNF